MLSQIDRRSAGMATVGIALQVSALQSVGRWLPARPADIAPLRAQQVLAESLFGAAVLLAPTALVLSEHRHRRLPHVEIWALAGCALGPSWLLLIGGAGLQTRAWETGQWLARLRVGLLAGALVLLGVAAGGLACAMTRAKNPHRRRLRHPQQRWV